MMNRSKILGLLVITALLFAYTSCEKDDNPDAPELPPKEAFAMDFSDFSDSDYQNASKKALYDMETLATYQNYGHAFFTVAGWNTIAALYTAVPVLSYAAILNTDPVYLGDNSWEWTASVEASGMDSYSARLVATRISNEEFSAMMYISKSGAMGFEDFLWYEGVIRYDRTHAEWTLYESPANPTALLSIEWNKDWEDGVSDISYTNVKEGGSENGSYIMYEILNDPVFDARYTVSLSDRMVIIEWNRETKAGHIQDPVSFEDELWHCWNELYQDVDCN